MRKSSFDFHYAYHSTNLLKQEVELAASTFWMTSFFQKTEKGFYRCLAYDSAKHLILRFVKKSYLILVHYITAKSVTRKKASFEFPQKTLLRGPTFVCNDALKQVTSVNRPWLRIAKTTRRCISQVLI